MLNKTGHYVLGIAGHIDHGKTTLTKALTGKETDRLKEEKERQISIELGFASFQLSNGMEVGVIDVPGHERFIRQMVAGVAGIDMVLLVVAADEGVMPQTREHLDILHLLGVKRGIIVLNKADLVDSDWLSLVEEEIRDEVRGTFLENSPVIPVSAKTGEGIPNLVHQVEQTVSAIPARSTQGPLRMPIDRAFSLRGYGTVVTGTIYEGIAQLGMEYMILPSSIPIRVRGIQIHGKGTDRAFSGQRAAINLVGAEVDEIHRGDVITEKGIFQPTQRMDVSLSMLSHLSFSLKQRSLVKVHIGTSEVLGTIIFFHGNQLDPGEQTWCQLLLKDPIVAKKGDHFIIRRPTPATTLGGGTIIDPYAKKHKFGDKTIIQLKEKEQGDESALLLNRLESEGITTGENLVKERGESWDLLKEILQPMISNNSIIVLGTGSLQPSSMLITKSTWQNWLVKTLQSLKEYHKTYPLRRGISKAKLKSELFPKLTQKEWQGLFQDWENKGELSTEDEWVFLPSFLPQPSADMEKLLTSFVQHTIQIGYEIPKWKDWLTQEKIPNSIHEDVTQYLLWKKVITSFGDDRYLSLDVIENTIAQLKKELAQPSFTVQDVKEIAGLSRKNLIPLMEWMDKHGLTARKENERRWVD
ncbi:selenocysteine-specific translation elongation factor [Microaerobacter geothermalis]|uniref:selenocysteine-specific translation elongation factor n=1 Tax=Microaerobacter geothermalis TaxID=674972 RepID=UPI001F275CDC|nr:selenocysteine-specific translation elongation factor [Microaerobacter geothermalis]MCF6094151.1 selenocysteine-specific translation elongation factor [Microaerobacter geothermalis]